jgi:hypothetical protein
MIATASFCGRDDEHCCGDIKLRIEYLFRRAFLAPKNLYKFKKDSAVPVAVTSVASKRACLFVCFFPLSFCICRQVIGSGRISISRRNLIG